MATNVDAMSRSKLVEVHLRIDMTTRSENKHSTAAVSVTHKNCPELVKTRCVSREDGKCEQYGCKH